MSKEKLEQMFGKLKRPKCNFMECLAGTGLAGTGRCFLGGNPNDTNCDKFISEDEFIEKLNKDLANLEYDECCDNKKFVGTQNGVGKY